MRAGGPAGATDKSKHITTFHSFANLYKVFRIMSVAADHTIAMVDLYQVSVSTVISNADNYTVSRNWQDDGAYFDADDSTVTFVDGYFSVTLGGNDPLDDRDHLARIELPDDELRAIAPAFYRRVRITIEYDPNEDEQ